MYDENNKFNWTLEDSIFEAFCYAKNLRGIIRDEVATSSGDKQIIAKYKCHLISEAISALSDAYSEISLKDSLRIVRKDAPVNPRKFFEHCTIEDACKAILDMFYAARTETEEHVLLFDAFRELDFINTVGK